MAIMRSPKVMGAFRNGKVGAGLTRRVPLSNHVVSDQYLPTVKPGTGIQNPPTGAVLSAFFSAFFRDAVTSMRRPVHVQPMLLAGGLAVSGCETRSVSEGIPYSISGVIPFFVASVAVAGLLITVGSVLVAYSKTKGLTLPQNFVREPGGFLGVVRASKICNVTFPDPHSDVMRIEFGNYDRIPIGDPDYVRGSVDLRLRQFPRLAQATRSQLKNYELRVSNHVIYWPELGFELSMRDIFSVEHS